MSKTIGKTLVAMIFVSLFIVLSGINTLSAPTVELNPAHPKPGGNVKFTATFPSGEEVQKVVLLLSECEAGLCFKDGFNETMSKTGVNTYEVTIDLKHDTAIELKYRVGYLINGTWSWSPALTQNEAVVSLDTSSDSQNEDNSENKSPGFEVGVLVFSVIFISVVLFRRKR